MIEPVQNCFTFYHPDGKSEAQIYSKHDEYSEPYYKTQITYNVAQQHLSLKAEQNNNNA